MFDFSKKIGSKRLIELANLLIAIQQKVDFKVSARGWCYLMEQAGYINKDQFNKVEDSLNRARKKGLLPVDFVAEETARAFAGVVNPSTGEVGDTLDWMLRDVLEGHEYFIPEYWEDEDYYIQVVVEKIDLKTLFEPVCRKYNIPIANSKAWSSILQRAEYAKRFKEAEEQGLKCVLLYCGDHDPDGLRISETIRKNLQQIDSVEWEDGTEGYDPADLEIVRFGLNYDFIKANNYTWIDNLITGSGKNLASPKHVNYNMPYVQTYLKTFGERKCEANIIVTSPDAARKLMKDTIEAYLGKDATDRFQSKRDEIKRRYKVLLDKYGIPEIIKQIQDDLDQ